MTPETSRWTTDLLGVLVATVLAAAAVLAGIDGSVLRTALLLPFVVFLPGYALVSALYPERRDEGPPTEERPVDAPGTVGRGITPVARVGLAVASSIALFAGVLLAFNFAVGALRPVDGFYALAGGTVILALIALARRWRLDQDERFAVPPTMYVVDAAVRPFVPHDRSLSESSTFLPTSTRGLLVNGVLAVSVLALVSSVAVAYAYPTQGEQFTELYLVTQSDDGEFVARDYPRTFEVGERRPVHVAVANHEGESTGYTLVATLQQVDRASGESRVTRERELMRTSRTVDAGETVRIKHDLQPSFAGDRLRVQYLLYVGDAPADPSAETAYRRVQLWITVDGGSAGGT